MTPTETTETTPTRRHTTTPTLRGAFTALVTPFTTDGALDEAAFGRLLDHQLDGGIDGLVPVRDDRRIADAHDDRARPRHRPHGRGRRGLAA